MGNQIEVAETQSVPSALAHAGNEMPFPQSRHSRSIYVSEPGTMASAISMRPATSTPTPTDAVRVEARPFVKWPGGKGQLLDHLLPMLLDAGSGTYHEPFLGGGAVFFALQREGLLPVAHLSDMNEELIFSYMAIRDDVDDVIRRLRKHKLRNDEEYYYRVRAESPPTAPAIAARMIYLNKTGYNGLYRVNKSGQFNVSWGRYKNPNICDEPNLRAVSKVLSKVELRASPFETILDYAIAGDMVYLDPPYFPVSKSPPHNYSADGFGPDDQSRLASVFRALDKQSVRIVLSNSECPEVRRLYRGFRFKRVQARRSINTDAKKRGLVPEVIVRNF